MLVATDTHIGYAEKDPVRGRDSINTFKEVLDLAVANDVRPSSLPLPPLPESAGADLPSSPLAQVDMLLLAGDLFHENRPSRTSLYQTISALRERCLSDRPIALELVSDAGVGIPRDVKCVAVLSLSPPTAS